MKRTQHSGNRNRGDDVNLSLAQYAHEPNDGMDEIGSGIASLIFNRVLVVGHGLDAYEKYSSDGEDIQSCPSYELRP